MAAHNRRVGDLDETAYLRNDAMKLDRTRHRALAVEHEEVGGPRCRRGRSGRRRPPRLRRGSGPRSLASGDRHGSRAAGHRRRCAGPSGGGRRRQAGRRPSASPTASAVPPARRRSNTTRKPSERFSEMRTRDGETWMRSARPSASRSASSASDSPIDRIATGGSRRGSGHRRSDTGARPPSPC